MLVGKKIVGAVLVNYNGHADTIECLQSLKEQVGVACRPLVVDNASQNDSVLLIKAAHPDVEVLQTKSNLGFTGGNNVGIARALEQGCGYVFLVNNDTILEPDCLYNLLECAQSHPEASVAVPAIYHYPEKTKPWFTGSTFDYKNGYTCHQWTDVRALHLSTPYEIPWATGCAMLIPAERIKALHGFDERYFLYWEDVDLSWRAQKAGGKCLLCPEAILYHKVAASAPRGSFRHMYYGSRNRLLFLKENIDPSRRQGSVFSYAKRALQQAKHQYSFGTTREDKKNAVAQAVGVADFLIGKYGRCRYSWI